MRYLLIALTVTLFILLGCPDYLSSGTINVWIKALTYHAFHANVFHLLANSLSIWLLFRKTTTRTDKQNIKDFLIAYIIATLTYFISLRPVVGISNIIFAVIGLRTPSFKSEWWKAPNTILFFIVSTLLLLFPHFSAITHIVSFVCGVLLACFNRKIKSLENDYRRATYK